MALFFNLAFFALALGWVWSRARSGASLSGNVLVAMLLGAALGALAQGVWGSTSPAIEQTVPWVALVGGIYVRLLQMIVVPLVLVSILGAVTRLSDARSLGAIAAGVLGVLLATTAVSAAIGFGVAHSFELRADGLVRGARELASGASFERRMGEMPALDVPTLLQTFVPTNVVSDLAGNRSTSVIGVVIFATLLGLAALALHREQPETGARVLQGIETAQSLIMRLVRMVIRLTPYGVLALMARVTATSNLQDILGLGTFVVASYTGLGVILLMHSTLLTLVGISPLRFYKKVWPVLSFAFSSRSSAAAIPLNVDAQITRLGVPPAIANFAASFGATIGQNGCAGLYPAMLAVMIAPSVGINPWSFGFFTSLVLVATLGSFGIAGVGGGATMAAIVVLSTLNLPVALAGLLISVEPLIDMGRTAINVSGSLTAGSVTSRFLGLTDRAVFVRDS